MRYGTLLFLLLTLAFAACGNSQKTDQPVDTGGGNGSGCTDPDPEPVDPLADWTLERLRTEGEFLMAENRWREAIPYFEHAVELTNSPSDELYNLACCQARVGKQKAAVKSLWGAMEAGVNQYPFVSADADLASLRDYEPYKEFLEELKREYDEWSEKAGELMYVQSAALEAVRVRLPSSYDPARSYPLVIGLHDVLSNGVNFMELYDRINYKSDFIFASIDAPYHVLKQGNFPGGRRWWIESEVDNSRIRSRANSRALVLEAARRVREKYKVDDNNVYLMGHGQGASMVYFVCSSHAGEFSGFIALGGRMSIGEPKSVARTNYAVLIGHARDDRNASFKGAKTASEAWKKAGADVTFEELIEWRTLGDDGATAIATWLKTEIDARTPEDGE